MKTKQRKKMLSWNEMKPYEILSWEEAKALPCVRVGSDPHYETFRGELYSFGVGGFIFRTPVYRRGEESALWNEFMYSECYLDQVIKHNTTIKLLSEMTKEDALRTMRLALCTSYTRVLWSHTTVDVDTGEYRKLTHNGLPYGFGVGDFLTVLCEYFSLTIEDVTGDLGKLEKEEVVVSSTLSYADIYTKTSSDIQDMYFKW